MNAPGRARLRTPLVASAMGISASVFRFTGDLSPMRPWSSGYDAGLQNRTTQVRVLPGVQISDHRTMVGSRGRGDDRGLVHGAVL